MGAERMRRPVLLIMGILVVAGLPARGLAQQVESTERNSSSQASSQASPQASPQRDFDDPRPIFKTLLDTTLPVAPFCDTPQTKTN